MKFKKVLGFWDIFWLGVGGMVGVAILTFPSVTYQQAGPAGILAWVFAGVFSLLMALVYSEMVTAFPKSGALVVFPYEAFKKGKLARYLAFLEGIGYYIGTVFGIVISAIILGNYISPEFATGTPGSFLIAEASILIVGIINLYGARITSKANTLMSIFFMAFFAIVIIFGLLHGSASNLAPFFSGSGGVGIIYGIPIAILAFGSWTALITIPEETKKVGTIPKAVIWSIITVTVLYVLIVLAVYMNLNAHSINSTYYNDPVLGLVASFNNGLLLTLFEVAAVLSVMAVMLVLILSNARIAMALSQINFLPKSMSKMSSRSIPVYATIASFAIPMLLSAFPNNYYQYVIIGAIVGTGLPRIIDLVSYFVIRKRSDYKPTFKLKYGVIISLLALVGLAVSELSLGTSDVFWSAVTLLALTGVFLAIEKWHKT
ncbi:MAG: APC family permease [Candidatus Marsarchaeota archaeon]|jgi:APA family basic amino acid/polyamine antiporter|nr:APC family permease [Candidatus Marsarchaeota archaeon]